MTNKKLIASIALLLFLCAIYLSLAEREQADLNVNKNWWTLAFNNPKSSDLSFAIENHSDKNNFHWEILNENGEKLDAGEIMIAKGSAWTANVQSAGNGKVTISASNGADKKDIYKNLLE